MAKKKLGLVLGAGSARGLAHIGVLQKLCEEGLKPDLIVGSSMGAAVGAFYAVGMDLYLLPRLISEINVNQMLDMHMPRKGFIAGNRITELIKLLTHNKNFEDVETPLAVVATDLADGAPYVFQTGPLFRAVRASISVPGVFQPVEIEDRVFVDGAVSERLPVSIARKLGADFVVAVDVTFGNPSTKANNIIEIILQSINLLEKQIHDMRVEGADILVQPDAGALGYARFDLVHEAVSAGREATEPWIVPIKTLLESSEG